MAFTDFGPRTFIDPGVTLRWTAQFGGFSDRGTVIMTPCIHPPNRGSLLVANNLGKSEAETNQVTYNVDITNLGSDTVQHNLEGGGVI